MLAWLALGAFAVLSIVMVAVRQRRHVELPTGTVTVAMEPYVEDGVVSAAAVSALRALSARARVFALFHATSDEEEARLRAQLPELGDRCLFYETACVQIVREFRPSVHFECDAGRAAELERLGIPVSLRRVDGLFSAAT